MQKLPNNTQFTLRDVFTNKYFPQIMPKLWNFLGFNVKTDDKLFYLVTNENENGQLKLKTPQMWLIFILKYQIHFSDYLVINMLSI